MSQGSGLATFKINEVIKPTLDSQRDQYGVTSDFRLSYQDKSTNVITPVVTEPFTELIKDIATPYTGATVSAIPDGSLSFEVDDATGLAVGDVVTVGTHFSYIIEIMENVLTAEKPIPDTAAGATVTLVGNTGIYTSPTGFSLPTAGRYNIIIDNPGINLQNVLIPIEVVENTVQDIHDEIVEIAEKLDISARRTTFTAWAQ